MLRKENFTENHIRKIQYKSKKDPMLIERTIYAFGLLEAIAKTGMPFIFKGGTCLMLLISKPYRLSTDIDIVVEPGTDVVKYIEKASKIFPFIKYEENKRIGKNNIEKQHFKFTYYSPISGKEFYILLDVLFEHNHYAKLENKIIKNELLITDEDNIYICVPSIECILGDKMTAFAPHTTGIPLNEGKNMEVMKQFYDVSVLLDYYQNFEDVKNTYNMIALSEIRYRGIECTPLNCIEDTFDASLCIASRGKCFISDYPAYVSGIRDLKGHIYSEKYSPEIAVGDAAKIAYMSVCLMYDTEFEKVADYRAYTNDRLSQKDLIHTKHLRKANPQAYAYMIKTDRILKEYRIL